MRCRFRRFAVLSALFGFSVLFAHPTMAQEWGREAWVAVYTVADEPGDTSFLAAKGKAIAMDGSENVYVLGEAAIPDQRTAAIIYKYNREDGSVAWRDVYNQVAPSAPGENDGSWDGAGAIAADTAGNMYVAIKSGHELYNRDYRVVVRKYGSDYATGEDPEWTYIYGTAEDGLQEAYAVSFDDSGNCYVAGYNAGDGMLFKVNSNGTLGSINVREESEAPGGWMYFYDLALDSSGNIYMCGQAQRPGDPIGQDNLVAKYDSSGVRQWLTYFGDSNGQRSYSKLALSPDGSAVYVAGRHSDVDHNSYWSVARFGAGDGEKDWHDYYQGSDTTESAYSHYPTSITVDAAGDVLVAGIATNEDTGADMAVVKYEGAATRNRMWTARYSGDDPSKWEIAVGVGTDAANNVYIAGQVYMSGSMEDPETMRFYDYATVKYSPEGGTPIWAFHYDYDGAFAQEETPAAMVVAPSGTVAVTGEAGTQGPIFSPMVTVLYSGDEDVGDETPTRPVFIPVPHIQASEPSTAGGGTVTYTYEWTSSDGQSVIHADRPQTESMLYQGENGITFSKGQTWTVTVTPKSGGVTGPAFTGQFTIGDSGSLLWGDKPGLGNAVYILQILSGARD